MKKLLFTTLLILLLPVWSWAATLYVTQTGTGNGGSYATAMGVGAHNANTYSIAAGDTVYLCDTITTLIRPPVSGTSGNVITYKGDYAGHAALIQVTGESQLRFDGIDYLTFDGIKFDGQNGNSQFGLFSMGQSEYITVINCWFEEQLTKGIAMWNDGRYYQGAGAAGPCRYWTVGGSSGNGNTFYNVGLSTAANIMSVWWSNNLVFSYNTIYSDKPPFGLGRSGLVIEDSSYVLVEYNNFYNLTNEDGIGGKNASYVIVRYNTSHDMQGGSGDINSQGTGINMAFSVNPIRPCHDWYVYGNTSYNNNKVGILVMSGATNINIWSNVIHTNGLVGIDVVQASAATTIKIYNNTIVNSGGLWGLLMAHNVYIAAATSAVIKNNIFYSSIKQPQVILSATSGVTMDYNHYHWTGGTPTVYWGSSFLNYNALPGVQEDNASTGNPNFTNMSGDDYTLLGTSPCKDTGVDLSGLAGSVTIRGADGYPGTVYMYWQMGLDDTPGAVDFSTTPPTVRMVPRGTLWEKGAYVYVEGGGANQPPNGTINTPASNPTVEVDDEVTLAGSYTDPEGDTCTYAWVIEADTFEHWAIGTTYSIGDIVEHADGSGTYYRSKVNDNLGNTPAIDANWENAETVQNPGTGVCDTAGVYSVSLTVSDDEPLADPTPASRTITVNTVTVGATTEVWGQNTGDDYSTDAITYINADQGACESSETILNDGEYMEIGRYAAKYRGSAIVKAGGYPAGCKIKLKLKKTGDLGTRTFVISEIPLSGSNLDLANAETVSSMAADSLTTSFAVYEFETTHDLTQGNMLVLWVTDTPESANYVSFSIDTDSNANLGDIIWYDYVAGAYGGAAGDWDFYIEIWEGGAALDDTNYGSATSVYAKKITVGDDDNQKIAYSVDLVALSGETVNDAKLELWLETAPTANINLEVWSCADAFVEGEATYNIFSTGNAWTGTHGQTTFLGEVAFTSGSSTGQYYTFTGGDFVSAVGTVATAGGVLRLILISDTNDISAIAFTSDDGTDEHRPKLTIEYGAEAASVPEVVSINIPGWKATYREGEVIPAATITFSEPVKGTSLVLTLDTDSDGANDATSAYVSGSGTATYTMTPITVTSDHGTASLDALTLTTPAGVIESTDDDEDIPETANVIDTIPLGATIGSLAYNTDIAIDTSANSATAVYGYDATYCSTCTADDTYATAGVLIQYAIRFEGAGTLNLFAEPGFPRQLISVHPSETIYSYAMGLGDEPDTIIMGFILTVGMRTLDLNFAGPLDFGPGGSLMDQAGNPVSTDMGALSLADVAAIVINVAGHFTVGSGKDIDKISDLVSQADTDVYLYYGPITDNVEITADDVMISGIGRTQVNTGTMTFSGNNCHVRCVNFSGAVTGVGTNGVEDETGATEMRGSFVDGQAWFHDAGGLIAVYAGTGNRLTVDDGSGNTAIGFIGEVGTGETLGAELLTNGNMETGDPPTGWNATRSTLDGVADERDGGVGAQSIEITATADDAYTHRDITTEVGELYEVSFWHKVTAGDTCFIRVVQKPGYIVLCTSPEYTNVGWENHFLYFVAETTTSWINLKAKTNTDVVYFDDVSVKKVTEPAATAVHIYKDAARTTEGWNAIDTGINYNAGTAWDFDVSTHGNTYHPICGRGPDRMGMNPN